MPDTREHNGVVMTTGLVPKPHDPRSERYALTKTVPRRAVDMSQPRYLCGPDFDWRTPVDKFGQKNTGSCSAWGTGAAAATAHRIALTQTGQDHTAARVVRPNPTWLYYHARLKHGWQHEDTGSVPEDCLDLLKLGAPEMTPVWPFDYVDDARWVPVPELEQAERFDYVLSYRPIYAGISDGYTTAEQIWIALDEGMPVNLACAWPDAFFAPVGPGAAVLPRGVSVLAGIGGHDFWCWGLADGIAWCDNSWSPGWTPQANQAGHYCRPGSFGVPLEYLGGTNNVLWTAQGVSYEPVPAPPDPEPIPEPHSDEWRAGVEAARMKVADLYNATPVSETTRRRAIADAHNVVYFLTH